MIHSLALCGLAFLVLWISPALARELYPGQYAQVDPATREWFKSVKTKQGIPCCDIADGHRTQSEKRVDGYWWVFIEKDWYRVPLEAVVMDAGNPFDEPVVWYRDYDANWAQQGGNPRYHIRCFVPPSEV
jgi:hypothetical protein